MHWEGEKDRNSVPWTPLLCQSTKQMHPKEQNPGWRGPPENIHSVGKVVYVLSMEKVHLFSLILEPTTESKPTGSRGIYSSFIITVFHQQIYSLTICVSKMPEKTFIGNDTEQKKNIQANTNRHIINKNNILPVTCVTLISTASQPFKLLCKL